MNTTATLTLISNDNKKFQVNQAKIGHFSKLVQDIIDSKLKNC